MSLSNIGKLIVAVGVSQLAGVIGSLFTAPAIPGWYSMIQKPELNPPSWVFGPVWITLYTLMGIAAYLVWQKGFSNPLVKRALYIFGIQLILNAIWSVLFFGLANPGLALIDIILLWLAIIWTIKAFSKVSRTAAYLLIPYILWVSFAVYLNYSIWMLN